MVTTPMVPAPPNAAGNVEGMPPVAATPPGTDMTGICFRDQLWINTYHLDRNLIFDYFALSPFYDWNCNNEQLRLRSIHPLDSSHLSKMAGLEYVLSEVMEPHLFVIRKQKRDSPEKVTPMLTYYILDGSIYQAPQLCNVFAARIVGYLSDRDELCTIYQKLLLLLPRSWKRLDMLMLKMSLPPLNRRPPRRPSISRSLGE